MKKELTYSEVIKGYKPTEISKAGDLIHKILNCLPSDEFRLRCLSGVCTYYGFTVSKDKRRREWKK